MSGNYVVHMLHPEGEGASNALCFSSRKKDACHVTANSDQVTCRKCLKLIDEGAVEKNSGSYLEMLGMVY